MFDKNSHNIFEDNLFDVTTNLHRIQELGRRLDERLKRLEQYNRDRT